MTTQVIERTSQVQHVERRPDGTTVVHNGENLAESKRQVSLAATQANIALAAASAVVRSELIEFTETLVDGEYTLLASAPYAGEVSRIIAQVTAGVSGTFDLTIMVDGVAVWGPTEITTTQTAVTVTEAFALGDAITALIENADGVTGALVQIDYAASAPGDIPGISGDWETSSGFTGAANSIAGFAADGTAENITVTGNATLTGGVLNIEGGAFSWIKQDADRTLTSTTSAQKIFSTAEAPNGALTLTTGLYRISGAIYATGVSGASNANAQLQLLGAGTAVLDDQFLFINGIDASSPTGANSRTGSAIIGSNQSPASMVSASSGSALVATWDGIISVTTAGTIIPSIALVDANAAVIKDKSYIVLERIGGATDMASANAS